MSTASAQEVTGLGIALVKQELECGVCLDIYERPVTLACGHSLCEACAKHMVAMEKSGSAFIRCPHCRAKTRWKSGKANLKVNITLQNMVERLKKAQKATEEQRKEQERQQAKQMRKEQKTKKEKQESSDLQLQKDPPAVDTSPRQASSSAGIDANPHEASSADKPLEDTIAHVHQPSLLISMSSPMAMKDTSAKGKGKEKSGSFFPLSTSPLFEDLIKPQDQLVAPLDPEAVAAFDAAIAAFLPHDESSSSGASSHQSDHALHGAQELTIPTSSDRFAGAASSPMIIMEDELLTPFDDEPMIHKLERRGRRSRKMNSQEWEARTRLSRTCRSRSPPPIEQGQIEHRSRSQETERSRSRSRTRGENDVTFVYDGIPEEYYRMLMGQQEVIRRVEESTKCKVQGSGDPDSHGISISGRPDDVRRARKQLVEIIREQALKQDRWSGNGSSGEVDTTTSQSQLVKKKLNISRRQYEMLLSNDLQLLHSIEATTDTSIIFPTNVSSRATTVPITIAGKREGVKITVDFLKANEEEAKSDLASAASSSGTLRSHSATVPVAPRSTSTRLGSSRSATHGTRRRRRRIPATEGRVPGCNIS